ncbi:MAG: hypothetical protein IJK84_07015 [Bacteroidales bacterium]|nr:hypothetical protein [Bacteroidales bacterium]
MLLIRPIENLFEIVRRFNDGKRAATKRQTSGERTKKQWVWPDSEVWDGGMGYVDLEK